MSDAEDAASSETSQLSKDPVADFLMREQSQLAQLDENFGNIYKQFGNIRYLWLPFISIYSYDATRGPREVAESQILGDLEQWRI